MLRENAAVAEQLCGYVSGSDVECGLDWSVFAFLGGGWPFLFSQHTPLYYNLFSIEIMT